MSTFVKSLFFMGSIFTFTGSFLPWWQAGDLVSYSTYGLQLLPTLKDNGGFLIALLTLIAFVLAFRPFDFIGKPSLWCLLCCLVIFADAVFQFYGLLVLRTDAGVIIGAPTIQFGLVMVLVGALFLLVSAILLFKQKSKL